MLAFPWQGKIVKSEICSCRWTTRKMWQGKLVIFFIYTTKENLSRKTCQGKLASVYSRQVFLDKWTCQGKIARVNGALLFSSVWKPRWNTKHEFLKWLLNRRLIANKRKRKKKRKQKSHKHVIFAFFCSISAQFVMIMSAFFTTEACLFQVATICIQRRPASSETWTG